MSIQSAEYINQAHSMIRLTYENGDQFSVPEAPGNRHYGEWLEWDAKEGNSTSDFAEPPITAAEVKNERQRRIAQIADPDKQAYFQRLMISWLEQGKDTWTPEQIAQVEAIRAGNQAIDTIVAKANALEAIDPIPTDYADDIWWS